MEASRPPLELTRDVGGLVGRPADEGIRRHDPDRLITVGLVDSSLDEPGAPFGGITPTVVAEEHFERHRPAPPVP